MGLREDTPRVVEAQHAERVFVAAPRTSAIFVTARFSLVPHQEEDRTHALSVHRIFNLSRRCDYCRAHARLLLHFPHGSHLWGFARLNVSLW